ncbi:ImmA/IrrE family metallo-endopeptidase [Microvirga arabica]|uniref:ImmA/IrrE family metallo-endopeptidase n=1 Tax=Microvirga arabica TaxID=1128671 RepID=UPI00193AC37D|nr:ImmA/IrrE family metallo-endopeptidase [Microvirga arabica]MBM1170196.1 ImmA/IrrE family metallo-endopeptidase [Microvirga arabica]
MSQGKKPGRWAADLTVLLNAAFPTNRFPVDVEALALDYSRQCWPDDPILKVVGESLPGFEGALVPMGRPRKGWGILYNNDGVSDGRRRFTVAHELAHYLMHRHLMSEDGVRCDETSVSRRDGKGIEKEADEFAAALLMPLDDMRRQIAPKDKPDLTALSTCADRYGVSLLAVTLRWLEYTERRSLLVVSRDGYALWARSSEPALRSGRFIRTSGEPFEIPAASCAGMEDFSEEARYGVFLPAHVWFPEPVEEVSFHSDRYDQVLTILHLGKEVRGYRMDEPDVEDTFDRFLRERP